jgi:hypothetical protein
MVQLDALVDLAETNHGLGAHLAPSRRLIKALAAIDLKSFDPILARRTQENPGHPPNVTEMRAYLAASADWFVKAGRSEDMAAQEAANIAKRKDVRSKDIKKWRQQYSGAGDTSTWSNGLATDRFRYLISKMDLGCKTEEEEATHLARKAKYL